MRSWNLKRESVGNGNWESVWSVAGVEAFHAFNWKLRIHVESALAAAAAAPKKTHLGSTVAQCCQLSQNMKIKRAGEEGASL